MSTSGSALLAPVESRSVGYDVDEYSILIAMTTRLQVLLDEKEFREIRRAAKAKRQTVSEWVRTALREARGSAEPSLEEKLRAIRDAAQWSAPTADIDAMNQEIERGRLGGIAAALR